MEFKAVIKEGKDKNGNVYAYLSIQLTPNYEKRVFFDNAEKEIISLYYQPKQNDSK